MHQRLLYLLNKHLTSPLDEEESREMRELLETVDMEEQIASFSNSLSTHSPAETDPLVLDRIAAAILNAEKRAALASAKTAVPSRVLLLRGWVRYAAAVILIVSTVAYLFSRQHAPEVVRSGQPNNTKSDIPPGGSKAIITLADGSTITLDSAGNGVLATQGSVNIVKNGHGITYYPDAKNGHSRTAYNTMSTPRSGQYQLTLSDGTSIWLNAASSITYPTAFAEGPRNVSITGEVYFEVAKDKARPFHVKTGRSEIEVLGTKFNINAYPNEDELQTTLLEGSVKISAVAGSLVLRPGQQAILNKKDGLSKNNSVDMEQVMAWKNGLFNFDHADLQSVMRQLERWYDIDVRYSGEVPERQIQGKMERRLTLGQVLGILEKMDINHKLEGRILTIRP